MKRIATLLFVYAVFQVGILAQSVSQIAGTVRDASGLAVPGAEVTATQTETGISRTAVTQADGTYVLKPLFLMSRRYGPIGRLASTYVPSPCVTAVRVSPVSV